MAKRYSVYKVTVSETPDVPIGKHLVDKGWNLHGMWTFHDGENFRDVVGARVARLCPTCREDYRRVVELDHDGDCSDFPPHLFTKEQA